ncbi:MAG: hypothetical protein DBY09_01590 [Selenomonadales bacterium]|nr:MAG: hypothetical protein DBY09_01590 [Selenomonadales bacterium]
MGAGAAFGRLKPALPGLRPGRAAAGRGTPPPPPSSPSLRSFPNFLRYYNQSQAMRLAVRSKKAADLARIAWRISIKYNAIRYQRIFTLIYNGVRIMNNSHKEKGQTEKQPEDNADRQIKIGKIILAVIGVVNVASAFALIIVKGFDFSILCVLVVQVCLALALFSGVNWVRYFLAIEALASVIPLIAGILTVITEPNPLPLILFIILALYQTASGLLLIFYRGVSEYIYAKKYP